MTNQMIYTPNKNKYLVFPAYEPDQRLVDQEQPMPAFRL